MNFRRLAPAALAAAIGFFSAQGLAQPYLGFSVGQSDTDEDVAAGLIDSGTVDGKDTGFKLYGGYRVNRHFALEAGYVDLGEVGYRGTFTGLPVTNGQIETSGLNLSAVGIVPIGQSFSLFGKVGLFLWESEATDLTGGAPFRSTADDTDVSFGLGASFDFGRNFSLRGEWERFEVAGSDSDLLSVGFAYRF